MLYRLKDIAAAMDCHERTAKRWWRKLGVPPDVRGHGPHRWHEATFQRLMHLWQTYYNQRGTTLQIVRAKYRGDKPTDKFQLELLTWQPRRKTGKKLPSESKARRAGNANAASARSK
jgi:hypothetical protein